MRQSAQVETLMGVFQWIHRALFGYFAIVEHEQHGRGNKEWWEGSYHNTKAHDQREVKDGFSSENGQSQQGDERRARGHHSSTKRLIEGMIDDFSEGHPTEHFDIFSDAVKDNDRVVERVTDDGHQSGDNLKVDLDPTIEVVKKGK